jgi:hypothetical protein
MITPPGSESVISTLRNRNKKPASKEAETFSSQRKSSGCFMVLPSECGVGINGAVAPELALRPNVRAKLPAEAGLVSPVRDDSTTGADRAYKACRSGSA